MLMMRIMVMMKRAEVDEGGPREHTVPNEVFFL
jgi:hypothetical protein